MTRPGAPRFHPSFDGWHNDEPRPFVHEAGFPAPAYAPAWTPSVVILRNVATGDPGTKDTVPFHIWKHEVELAAIRRGASDENVRAASGRLRAWYNAGEPIWMAGDALYQFARGHERAHREDSDRRVLAAATRRRSTRI